MATRLKNILTFTGLTVGIPVALPHLLNIDGIAIVPDKIEANEASATVVASDTTVTVTPLVDIASMAVYVELWYSPERVFGTPSDPLFTQIPPTPFVMLGGGASGGGSAFSGISVSVVSTPAIGSGVLAPIAFSTVDLLIGTGLSLTGGFITVNTAGVFVVTHMTNWATNAVGLRQSLLFTGAGTPTVPDPNGQVLLGASPASKTIYTGTDGMLPLAAGQTIELRVEQQSGGPLSVSYASLSVIRVA